MEWNRFKARIVDGAENLNSAKKNEMNEMINNIISSFGNFFSILSSIDVFCFENLRQQGR